MSSLSKAAANNSLTIYLTLGFPFRDVMLEVVGEIVRLGVDMLEFGIPYEAPKYDGPTIRRTHKRVLSSGFKYGDALELLREVSFKNRFMLTYYELALKVGVEKFFSDVAEAGARAVLFPDLLIEYPEELERYDRLCSEYGLEKVYFVSSSFPHRLISGLAERGPAFIYMGLMASTGVALPITVRRNITIIKGLLGEVPMIGGFAIKSAEQVRQYRDAGVNGIVIGSAVARIIEDNNKWREDLRSFLKPIISALKER